MSKSKTRLVADFLGKVQANATTGEAEQADLTSVVGEAPTSLDTLDEIAAAINDDANYHVTVSDALATKLEDITAESIEDLSDVTVPAGEPSSGSVPKYTGAGYEITKVTTDEVVEEAGATNVFYTDARAQAAISTDTTLTYSAGEVSMPASGVTAGAYGSASEVPVLTVDEQGRVTAASTTSVAGVSSFTWDNGTNTLNISTADGGSFSADITSLSTNVIAAITDTAPGALDTLNELAAAINDDADFAGTVTQNLAGKVDKINITGNTFGSANAIPSVTYNDQGQITAASSTAIGGSVTGPFSDLGMQYGASYSGTPRQGSFFFDSANERMLVNTGSGWVGTDAETLDGLDSTQFLRSGVNDTYTGLLSLGSTESRIVGSDGFPLVQVNSSRAYFGSTSRSKTVLASSSNTGAKSVVAGTEYSIFHDNYHPNADKWTTARTLSLTGDVTGSVSWDGSVNASITATVGDNSHNHTTVSSSFSITSGQLIGGIGAATTSGTTDWNHSTNARSGNGYTLLLGTATNGPGTSDYYHPFSFEYNSKDGSGNMNQFAIPYNAANGPYFRTRYSGTWTGWRELWHSGNDGSGSGLDADKLDGVQLSAITHSGDSVALTGDVTGSTTVASDGSISISTTVLNDSHTHDSRYARIVSNRLYFGGVQAELDALKSINIDTSFLNGSSSFSNGGIGLQTAQTITHDGNNTALRVYDRRDLPSSTSDYSHFKVDRLGDTTPVLDIYTQRVYNAFLGNIDTTVAKLDGNKIFHEGYHPNADNADTLDGLNSTQFLRSDADDTMTGNLTVNGNISHQGLTPTSGFDIDQIWTVTKSLQVTTDWIDTGIDSSHITSWGSYMVQMYVDNFDAAGQEYQEFYTGVMSWRGSTNSEATDEIILHAAGHGPNNGRTYLRTRRSFTVDGAKMYLQIKGDLALTAADNYIFKFRRMM